MLWYSGMEKQAWVYIVTNCRNGTLYTGVTSNIIKRVYEHRTGAIKGFTAQYDCKSLVYFEQHDRITDAILREKQIKAGSRAGKLALIEGLNPDWRDLYDEIIT